MGKFSKYNIDLKNLPEGLNTFSYELDNTFFNAIDHEDVGKGNVNVEFTVKKTTGGFEFNFHLSGTVKIPCNRCLDEMSQEIDTDNRIIVRLGKEYSEESDELIIIPEDEGAINIAWFLYEFIVLNIPIKHVHPAGQCNRTMSSKYRKHKAVSIDDEDSDDDDDAFGNDDDDDDDSAADEVDETPQNTDLRWDELKKLI